MTQWTPTEIELRSKKSYPWWEFPVEAVFSHEDTGTKLRVEAFFNGDHRYVIRFAPPLAGEWHYQTRSVDPALGDKTGTLVAGTPTPQQVAANPNLHGHLGVSDNGRFFQHADGKPFFLLADTNWSINTARCGLGDDQDGPFYHYLNDRKSKGFTAILMAYMRGFGDTNEPAGQRNEGGYPFVDGHTTELNPDYFRSLDTRMSEIWDCGFVAAVHPTWFAKRNCFFDHESAKRISAYLAVRYGAYNCIWSLSGEYQYTMKDCGWNETQLSELGEEVQKHNPHHHPLSIHPSGSPKWQPPHGNQSSRAFHDAAWLDHNWLQTGQKLPTLCNVATRALDNYKLSPTKPVFLSEGYYERHTDPEHAYHSRWQAWTAFLNGSAGYGYGAMGVWQFYTPDDAQEETGKKTDGFLQWQEAMDMEGAAQMRPVRRLLTSLSWWELRPIPESIEVNGKGNRLPTPKDITPPHSAQSPDGTMVVYIPQGNADNKLNIKGKLAKDRTAYWYDPRSADRDALQERVQLLDGMIPPRPDPSNEDWVLVLGGTTSGSTTQRKD